MKNKVFERMHRFSNEHLTIRVWEKIDSVGKEQKNPIVEQLKYIVSESTEANRRAMSERLFDFVEKEEEHNIEAIEVLDMLGNGYLFYPDWR